MCLAFLKLTIEKLISPFYVIVNNNTPERAQISMNGRESNLLEIHVYISKHI